MGLSLVNRKRKPRETRRVIRMNQDAGDSPLPSAPCPPVPESLFLPPTVTGVFHRHHLRSLPMPPEQTEPEDLSVTSSSRRRRRHLSGMEEEDEEEDTDDDTAAPAQHHRNNGEVAQVM